MKKQSRKIHLHRETLIHLAGETLDEAAGGIAQKKTVSCHPYSGCITCSPCPLT